MDPETVEMPGEEFSVEEFDIDFEFDAPRFFDFSRPELDSEAEEADLWFEFSGNYPPSPFSLKFNWRYKLPTECTSTGSEYNTGENLNPVNTSLDIDLDREETIVREDKYNGFIYYNQTVKDVRKARQNSQNKPHLSRNSTLTKPTASLLARQNKPLDVYSVQLLRKCQRSLGKFDDKVSSLLSSTVQIQDTKRQKLEVGFLRKVSRLDQALFVHKVPRKRVRVNSNDGRSKVTVPREPNLKTAQRAERHKSKVNLESVENAASSSNSTKMLPMNKNVPEASSTSLPKRRTPRIPHFQEFHLMTSLRATQRSSHNARNAPTDDSMQQNDAKQSRNHKSVNSSEGGKFKGIHRAKKTPQAYESKVCPLDPKISIKEESREVRDIEHETAFPREFKAPTDASFQDELPIESFSKLCLDSDSGSSIKTRPKAHTAAEKVNVAIERSESFHGNSSSCGSDRKPLLDVNRSLDLRREFDPQDVSGNLIFA